MFYDKNNRKELSGKLFECPTSEYRGAPFWAWNDKLDKNDLLWQIEQFGKMGLGGFHMHVRSGLETPYLSDEFMELIRACVDKAEQKGMKAYLYDEDRWPSGAAGGIVTKNHEFRQRLVIFTQDLEKFGLKIKTGGKCENSGVNTTSFLHPVLLAAYDVKIDDDGFLTGYARVPADKIVCGTKWFAVAVTMGDSGWFNGQAYIDTLSKEAMAEFIRVTYETYFDKVGSKFGSTVPSVFTDEPQVGRSGTLEYATGNNDVSNPWTPSFPEKFREKYGMELLDRFPEIIWDRRNEPATVRYYFHDLICELFTEAFSDQCGKWCGEHGIALTGHMLHEETLKSQTAFIGEAMRAYRGFQIPGIDILCDATEFSTAKQCQSAVNQYGREAMTSELYGVTGWDFDFRGHKFQGDWQAAMGVTLRVPHLSWVSMKGSAKRDYPASISYQSEWFKNYSYVENHFARVNTAMTRGVPDVKVAVIHPIESYWLAYGPNDTGAEKRAQLQNNFDNVRDWLLFGTVDFDYISESLLPSLYRGSKGARLGVGKMNYSAVVVAGMDTLRSSTVEILEDFMRNGGKVVFLGEKPRCVDAVLSDKADALYAAASKPAFTETGLLDELKPFRDIEIRKDNGEKADEYIYRKRIDGKTEWIFIARGKKHAMKARDEGHNSCNNLFITVKGIKKPVVYDTLSGKTEQPEYRYVCGNTEIKRKLYRFDSLLLRLDDVSGLEEAACVKKDAVRLADRILEIKEPVKFRTGEKNVLVLDMPQWSEDGINYNPAEEILRIDLALRQKYGYPKADGCDVQPWVIGETVPEKSVYLKFTVDSKIAPAVKLAFEEAEKVWLNGSEIKIVKDGYFTDKRIYTAKIGRLKKGLNTLVVKAPLGKRISLENLFLLGDFGVSVKGASAVVTAKPRELSFGSLTGQGYPFYGADVTYEIPFECGRSDLKITASLFAAALLTVKLDGKEAGNIAWCPYSLEIGDVPGGKHVLSVTAHVTRVNSFGGLHACSDIAWKGPGYWYTCGTDWAYEYQLKETGILKSPVIEIFEKK